MLAVILSGLLAVTINVSPGQSISNAVSNAASGDTVNLLSGVHTVSGVTVNKPIILQGQPGAIMRPATAGNGTGISASNGAVIQNLKLENYRVAFGVSGTGVTLYQNHSYRSQYHVYMSGSNHTIDGNRFERCNTWGSNDDTDYMRITGSGHVVRFNMLYGTQIPSDLDRGGGDYAHNDVIQFEGWTGAILQNCIFEYNFCTDFVQGFWISDETSSGKITNLTIRDNVFWGTNFQGGGNLLGVPSWGVGIGKSNGFGGSNSTIEHNLFWNCANHLGLRGSSTTAKIEDNVFAGPNSGGTVYQIRDGAASSSKYTGAGDLVFRISYLGPFVPGPILRTDPGFANQSNPLGVDGQPWTDDDGFRLTVRPEYGPRRSSTPPPPTPNVAPTANAGADQNIVLNIGESARNVTLDGSGSSDSDGVITDYVWTGTPDPSDVVRPVVSLGVGVHNFALVVVDDDLAMSAEDIVTVTVTQSSPPQNALPVANAGQDQVIQLNFGQSVTMVQLHGSGTDSDGTVVGYTWSDGPSNDPADVAEPILSLGPGTYVFTLVVTDNQGATSQPDSVVVTVNAAVEPPDLETRLDNAEALLQQLLDRIVALEEWRNSFPFVRRVRGDSRNEFHNVPSEN